MNFDKLKDMDKNDLLNLLGLETRRNSMDYLLPGLALFGVGLLVGTGVGVLVAPRSGRETREDLSRRLQEAPDALANLPQRASDAFHRASEQLAEKTGGDGKVA